MGKTHKKCDDFAISRHFDSEGLTISIVSDGCSGSDNTDIGSRLLCSDIIRSIPIVINNYECLKKREFLLTHLKSTLFGLYERYSGIYGKTFLDCTFLIAISNHEETTVFMIGDGNILIETKDKQVKLFKKDFEGNAPGYPSYLIDLNRREGYLSAIKKTKKLTHISSYIDGKLSDGYMCEELSDINSIPVDEYCFKHSDLNKLILCTDGLSSFSSDEDYWVNVGRRLLDIKSPMGVFLQRRALKIIEEESKIGNFNSDDFSGVGILYD